MSILSFDFDWLDPEGVAGAELAATSASLRIQAGESCVSRVLDTRAKTVRESLYVPLYPLAEWLATNWWFLIHEFENPDKQGDPDFHRRHTLEASREGYAFPNLEIVSSGTRTRLRWSSGPSPWTRVEFLGQGEVWIDTDELRETCTDFIDGVSRRLVCLGVDGTLLQEEWAAIQTADDDESRFCAVAATLGWDPYDVNDEKRSKVLLLAEKLGDLLDEAAPALDASHLDEGYIAVQGAITHAKAQNGLALGCMRSLRGESLDCGSANERPWRAGWNLAARLRQDLGVDGEPLPTTARLAEVLVVRFTKQLTFHTMPRSKFRQRTCTGSSFISAMPWRMRDFSSSVEATRMWRRKVRAIFEKAHSIRFSQEPCFGV